jgi:hypothetical protein
MRMHRILAVSDRARTSKGFRSYGTPPLAGTGLRYFVAGLNTDMALIGLQPLLRAEVGSGFFTI